MGRESTFKGNVVALERGGAAEQIIADLQDQILRGKLARGAKLPNERMLAERYGVSSPTIREAVRGLAAIKMVEPRHGAGTYVIAEADAMFAAAATSLLQLNKITLLDVLDLLETLLEKVSALACAHAEDEELLKLSRMLEKLESADQSDDFTGCLAAFIGSLADASHNVLIATLTKFLVNLLIELIRERPAAHRAEVAAKLRTDRRRLVEALMERDPQRAARFVVRYHAHTRSLLSGLVAAENSKSRDHMHRACRRLRGAR
jgi:GntR family transcriptional regulator, transcriptional repressor for pyruvate dehydrogenase complex